MDLAERLDIPREHAEAYGLVERGRLRPPAPLIGEAVRLGPNDPAGAQAKLAAAVASAGERTSEGRHAAALTLLAPLVARADPMMTLGPNGAELRAEIMPNGWLHTLSSWERLRYAWLTGLPGLLGLRGEDRLVVNALNQVMRLTEAEPEPVKVAIQEQWPAPAIAFGVGIIGILVSGINVYQGLRSARRR